MIDDFIETNTPQEIVIQINYYNLNLRSFASLTPPFFRTLYQTKFLLTFISNLFQFFREVLESIVIKIGNLYQIYC